MIKQRIAEVIVALDMQNPDQAVALTNVRTAETPLSRWRKLMPELV